MANWQQILAVDAKYNAYRAPSNPHFRTLYIKRRSQLLRESANDPEKDQTARKDYLHNRAKLLAAKYGSPAFSDQGSIKSRSFSFGGRSISNILEDSKLGDRNKYHRRQKSSGSVKFNLDGPMKRVFDSIEVVPTEVAEASRAMAGGKSVSENYAFAGMHHIFDQHTDAVTSVKFANDDKSRVACSSVDGSLSVCQVIPPPATVICMLKGHTNAVSDFVWSLSNDIILSVSYDSTARLWNVASGECIRTIKDITGAELHCCLFHPLNNNMFVTGNSKCFVQIINVSTGKGYKGGSCKITGQSLCMAFDSTGQTLWVGDDKGSLSSFNVGMAQGKLTRIRRVLVCEGHAVTSISARAWVSREAREPSLLVNCAVNSLCLFSQDEVYLYGVFDGHDTAQASNFASQRVPAELLLGQLSGKTTDEEVKEVLYQAFIAVEKSYFESIDEQLAARTTLQLQLPEGISYHEACQQYPDIIEKLHKLNAEISGGTTATVVLIYNNKLYVANVGDTRALLVRTDVDGIMSVTQLTVDHTIESEQEQQRLAKLGLDVEKLFQLKKIGTSDCTRCIGDFHAKGGYKDIDVLSAAEREPVIAEPYVTGGIPVDSTCSFLIIMSDGLYHALQAATDTATVNTEVASMVAQEFSYQSTLNGVAQACVDKVVRIHHDSFMMGTQEIKLRCHKRGDITLLVRNFNNTLPNAIGTPTGPNRFLPVSVPYYTSNRPNVPPVSFPDAISATYRNEPVADEAVTPVASDPNPIPNTPSSNLSLLDTSREQTRDSHTSTGTYSTNSTQSSEESTRFPSRFYKREKLVLDENGCVEAYVDFSDFYRVVEAMTDSQRETLNNETKPKSGYETIIEETSTAITSTTASTPVTPQTPPGPLTAAADS